MVRYKEWTEKVQMYKKRFGELFEPLLKITRKSLEAKYKGMSVAQVQYWILSFRILVYY